MWAAKIDNHAGFMTGIYLKIQLNPVSNFTAAEVALSLSFFPSGQEENVKLQ